VPELRLHVLNVLIWLIVGGLLIMSVSTALSGHRTDSNVIDVVCKAFIFRSLLLHDHLLDCLLHDLFQLLSLPLLLELLLC
jgi:hypothetical protein